MLIRLSFIAAIFAATCTPSPAPAPDPHDVGPLPPDPGPDAAACSSGCPCACSVLRRFTCHEGEPTAKGVVCERLCPNRPPDEVACVAAALSRDAIRACGVRCEQ